MDCDAARQTLDRVATMLALGFEGEAAPLTEALEQFADQMGDDPEVVHLVHELAAQAVIHLGAQASPAQRSAYVDRLAAALDAFTRHLAVGAGHVRLGPRSVRDSSSEGDDREAQGSPRLQEPHIQYDTELGADVMRIFFEEAAAHLNEGQDLLLHLESTPDDRSALDGLFREIHSLKGIAGYLNVGAIRSLAHHIETFLGDCRQSGRGPDRTVADLILQSLDLIRSVVTRIQHHCTVDPTGPFPALPAGHSELLHQLEQMTSPGVIRDAPGPNSPPIAPSPESVESPDDIRTTVVRVSVEKLDRLIDAIGELSVTQAQVASDPDIIGLGSVRLEESLGQLQTITYQLQTIAQSLRLCSVSEQFSRVARIARDLSRAQSKDVAIELRGRETELDRTVIEQLADPLVHLVRNAIDHGIETPSERARQGKPTRATLEISAHRQGDGVVISVRDDGRGLDTGRIRERARSQGLIEGVHDLSDQELQALVFRPGFSTTTSVSEVSGRGVGLDVVSRNVDRLGGRIRLRSTSGKGTCFELQLPLTLAILEGVMVRVGRERYIVPITTVVESIHLTPDLVTQVASRSQLLRFRNRQVPLLDLQGLLGASAGNRVDEIHPIAMVIDAGQRRIGLRVDEVVGQFQVVIKSLGSAVARPPGIAAGAIVGDGTVCLILDVHELVGLAPAGSSFTAMPSNVTPVAAGAVIPGEGLSLPEEETHREEVR